MTYWWHKLILRISKPFLLRGKYGEWMIHPATYTRIHDSKMIFSQFWCNDPRNCYFYSFRIIHRSVVSQTVISLTRACKHIIFVIRMRNHVTTHNRGDRLLSGSVTDSWSRGPGSNPSGCAVDCEKWLFSVNPRLLLVGPVWVYCDWVGYSCCATSIIPVWQHLFCPSGITSMWPKLCRRGVNKYRYKYTHNRNRS